MHAAGDPGASKVARTEPGFLGRAQHVHGWVVRAIDRDPDDPKAGYEPGLFVTVEGHLHRLTSKTRGIGMRDGVRYVDLVGPEITDPAHDGPLGRRARGGAAGERARRVGYVSLSCSTTSPSTTSPVRSKP